MRLVSVFTSLLVVLLLAVAPPIVAGQLQTLVLEVDGMTSACCEDQFRWLLFKDVDGVRSVDADHQKGLVTIGFEPEIVALATLVKRINDVPSFRVTGSTSHTLDASLLSKDEAADARRPCGKGCTKPGCTKKGCPGAGHDGDASGK